MVVYALLLVSNLIFVASGVEQGWTYTPLLNAFASGVCLMGAFVSFIERGSQ